MNQNRLLFLVPPNITYKSFVAPQGNVKVATRGTRTYGTVVTDMPLGPLSLSAYARKNADVTTRMVDFNVVLARSRDFDYRSFKEFFSDVMSSDDLVSFSPNIIGISALFGPAYKSMIDLAEVAKTMFPTALILAGGFLATNLYRKVFEDSEAIDALCSGEGERPLVRLLCAEDKTSLLDSDSSWITRRKLAGVGFTEHGRGIVKIGSRGIKEQEFGLDLIHDLDEIPFLDYELCDLDGYKLNPTVNAYPALTKVGQAFHVMTSRGCVYSCSFCAQDTVHGKAMRYSSLARVREDLARLRERYDVQTIVIEDDHFMGDPQRAHEILGILIELGMTACFPNALALYALKRPMLERLKAVGVNQLVLAVESGSAEVLHNIMRKPLKLDIVSRVTSDCREVGIYTDCNLVIGQPGETVQHFEESRHFLRGTYANWFRPNIATPVTGSELLSRVVNGSYLKGEYADSDYKSAVIETEDFTSSGVQKIAYLMNIELNFVYNSDIRLGDYATALVGFENAIRARPDHYFAHRYAAECQARLGNSERAQLHRAAAAESAKSSWWQEWIEMIDQPLARIARS